MRVWDLTGQRQFTPWESPLPVRVLVCGTPGKGLLPVVFGMDRYLALAQVRVQTGDRPGAQTSATCRAGIDALRRGPWRAQSKDGHVPPNRMTEDRTRVDG